MLSSQCPQFLLEKRLHLFRQQMRSIESLQLSSRQSRTPPASLLHNHRLLTKLKHNQQLPTIHLLKPSFLPPRHYLQKAHLLLPNKSPYLPPKMLPQRNPHRLRPMLSNLLQILHQTSVQLAQVSRTWLICQKLSDTSISINS
jgi:hypothetical protein